MNDARAPWRQALASTLLIAMVTASCLSPSASVPAGATPAAPAEVRQPASPTQKPATAAAAPTDPAPEPTPVILPPLRDLAEQQGLLIGAAVSAGPLRGEPVYGQVLGREFNLVTTENALKFGPVHPSRDRYDFRDADAIVAFAEAHGMQVRGHTLVWHEQVPAWIESAAGSDAFDEAEWEAVLEDHIKAVVGRYRGRIQIWDVVNEAIGGGGAEPLRRTLWLDGVGADYIDKAFRWAHEADPDALLFYNDYGAEDMGPKSRSVYELVAGMVERGVPIHGVGLQMHVKLGAAPDVAAVLRNMQRLGDLGLQVHVTELDVRVPAGAQAPLLERQATVYADLLGVCLQVDACTAFILWGFTDAHSWIPDFFAGEGDALIFDTGYVPKPAYHALQQVLSGHPPER
jgi:endo-1,4-beta-xylanase